MPDAIDHDQHVQPCLVPPGEYGRAEEAGVEDEVVSLPPGLRKVRLSEEAAQAMRDLLDDEGHAAHVGREMPTADASALRKKAP